MGLTLELQLRNGVWSYDRPWYEVGYNKVEKGYAACARQVQNAAYTVRRQTRRVWSSVRGGYETGIGALRGYTRRFAQGVRSGLEAFLAGVGGDALEARLGAETVRMEEEKGFSVYVRYCHEKASDEMKQELVRWYRESSKSLRDVAKDLGQKYGMPISASTVSRRARKALGVRSRREARAYVHSDRV